MSMVLTRSPLTAIGMNGAGAAAPKRRSARLSADGNENQDEPPSKKARVNAAVTSEDGAVKKKGRKKGTSWRWRVEGLVVGGKVRMR